MNLLTICGSLRARSVNAALVRALPGLAPADVTFTHATIGDLPLYNDELQGDPAVARFRDEVTNARAVLIVSPEYNYGIPGPLKNAIDWASRPAYKSPFVKKPVGMMGVSASITGTARMQGQLKQVLLGMASQVYPAPEVLVGTSAKKFDADLHLVDDETKVLVSRYLAGFVAWAAEPRG